MGVCAGFLRGLVDLGHLQAFPDRDGDLDRHQRSEQIRQHTSIGGSKREDAQPVPDPDDRYDRNQRESSRPYDEKIEAKRDSSHKI